MNEKKNEKQLIKRKFITQNNLFNREKHMLAIW